MPATDESPGQLADRRSIRCTTDTVRSARGRVALTALASGLGLALSLPPWGLWILAFPAAGLLWWRLAGLRPRTRLWAGWLAGLGCYVPGLLFTRSFTLAGAVVLIALEALFIGVACLAVPRGPVVARALAFPAAMTLAEAARQGWPFGGLPIGGVFLGQAGGPLLGVARIGGPLGLTIAVYVGGVGLAALGMSTASAVRPQTYADGFRDLHDRHDASATSMDSGADGSAPARRPGARDRIDRNPETVLGDRQTDTIGRPFRRSPTTALLISGAVAMVGLVGTGVAAAHAPDGGPSVGTVTAVAVQGGGARGYNKSQVDPSVVLAAALAATQPLTHVLPGSGPHLVLWPEDVVSLVGPLPGSTEEAVLSQLAVALHATLVVGITETVSGTAFRNEVVAFGPDGTIASRYEKVHRVPFGEYVPWRSFFARLGNLSAVSRDAVPGTGTGVLATPVGPLGAMISYEVFYSDRGRTPVRAGAELLIVPTNTSSYATSQVPTQEIAASQVQATQLGRDLIQAAPTGYTAWITHRGDELARSVLGARQLVPAVLHRRTGTTVYVRWGDTPALAASLLALATGWWLSFRQRRRPHRRETVYS
jgi:apolipoprotein N-acyltransferase